MDSRRQADSSIIPRRALVIAFSIVVGCSSGDSDPMTDTAKAVHPPNPPSQAIQVEAGSDQVVHVGETVQQSQARPQRRATITSSGTSQASRLEAPPSCSTPTR